MWYIFVFLDFGIVSTVWYIFAFLDFGIVPTVWYIFVFLDFGIVPTVWYIFVFLDFGIVLLVLRKKILIINKYQFFKHFNDSMANDFMISQNVTSSPDNILSV